MLSLNTVKTEWVPRYQHKIWRKIQQIGSASGTSGTRFPNVWMVEGYSCMSHSVLGLSAYWSIVSSLVHFAHVFSENIQLEMSLPGD